MNKRTQEEKDKKKKIAIKTGAGIAVGIGVLVGAIVPAVILTRKSSTPEPTPEVVYELPKKISVTGYSQATINEYKIQLKRELNKYVDGGQNPLNLTSIDNATTIDAASDAFDEIVSNNVINNPNTTTSVDLVHPPKTEYDSWDKNTTEWNTFVNSIKLKFDNHFVTPNVPIDTSKITGDTPIEVLTSAVHLKMDNRYQGGTNSADINFFDVFFPVKNAWSDSKIFDDLKSHFVSAVFGYIDINNGNHAPDITKFQSATTYAELVTEWDKIDFGILGQGGLATPNKPEIPTKNYISNIELINWITSIKDVFENIKNEENTKIFFEQLDNIKAHTDNTESTLDFVYLLAENFVTSISKDEA